MKETLPSLWGLPSKVSWREGGILGRGRRGILGLLKSLCVVGSDWLLFIGHIYSWVDFMEWFWGWQPFGGPKLSLWRQSPVLWTGEVPLETHLLKVNTRPLEIQHELFPFNSSRKKQILTFQGSRSPPGTPRSYWRLSSRPRWRSGRAGACQGPGCAGQLAFCRQSEIQGLAYSRVLPVLGNLRLIVT